MTARSADTFARQLRAARERPGLDQAELARRMAEFLCMSVDPPVVTRLEQQTRTVKLDQAVALAAALGAPLLHYSPTMSSMKTTARSRCIWPRRPSRSGDWKRTRQKSHQITRTIRMLRSNRELLRRFAPGDAGPGVVLAPEFQNAIDAQITTEDGG